MTPRETQLVAKSRKAFTRMTRFVSQLLREQLAGTPFTIQQFYTLEALADTPRTMNELAREVALHQSTLTRIVEKLEKQGYLVRDRVAVNQRKVEVRLTEKGRETWRFLDAECDRMIAGLMGMVPRKKQAVLIESIEEISRLLDHRNSDFRRLLSQCCSGGGKGGVGIMDKIE